MRGSAPELRAAASYAVLSLTEALLPALPCRKSEKAPPRPGAAAAPAGLSLPLLCSRALLAAASIAWPTVALPRFTFFTVESRLERRGFRGGEGVGGGGGRGVG